VRTTLTLDDDVAKLLEKEVRRTGEPFKVTVNQLLRRGLASSQQPQSKPFKVTPWKMGLPPGLSYDNIHELLEAIEGPDYR
jgi:hypothetical protein